jgi:hypothetical protein
VNAVVNQPPTVVLISPPDGATFDAGRTLWLRASASDSDGAIAKVEFFDGTTKLGESASAPYRYAWTNAAVGAHTLTAVAYDDHGASTTSDPRSITIGLTPAPMLVTSFEAAEGFTAGSLRNQNGWAATSATAAQVTTSAGYLSSASIVLQPVADPVEVDYPLTSLPEGHTVLYFDFWAKPVARSFGYDSAATFNCAGSSFGLVLNAEGKPEINGISPSGDWISFTPTGVIVPVGADATAIDWVHFTVRQDYGKHTWDLYIGGKMILNDASFYPPGDPMFTLFGHTKAPVRLDRLSIGFTNPLFPDADNDGMDDTWETAHGLDPTANDRDLDYDNDGLTNIAEYILGTDPDNPDTDGDGLPDGWEVQYGFNPLVPEPASVLNSDADGDGLTLLQEAKAGTNPNNADTDGDGLSDGVEVRAGLNPLRYDADEDTDGDGVSNRQEIANGTNPNDYYNGQKPVVTSLNPPGGALIGGNHIAVRVMDAAGTPLTNAPVVFTARSNDHGFSPTLDHKWDNARRSITVRTDWEGIARAYVVRTDELLAPLP